MEITRRLARTYLSVPARRCRLSAPLGSVKVHLFRSHRAQMIEGGPAYRAELVVGGASIVLPSALRRRPRCDLGGPRPLGEDTDHVEAHGLEVWLCGVEVVFGYGAQGILLAGGDGFQWVSEAGPTPQLDFHKDEYVVLEHYQVNLPAPGPVVTLQECVTVLDQVAQGESSCPWGFVFQSPTPA